MDLVQKINDAYFDYTYARDKLSEESTTYDRNEVEVLYEYYISLKKEQQKMSRSNSTY